MEKIKKSDDLVRYLILGISTVVIVVFFARFCAKPNTLSVTFDGYLSSSTIIVEKDGTIKEPSTPTRDGYKFIGWYLNGKPFDFSTKITKNITLEARWEKVEDKDSYTVTFVTGNGSFTREVKKNSTVEEPSCEALEGNTCKGWYLGSALYDFSTPVTSDLTLEARYDYNGEINGGDVDDNANTNSKDKEAPKDFTPTLQITTNKVVVTASTTDNNTSKDKLVYSYSLDGKKYQSSNTFTGLSNNTEYTVYVKVTDEDGNSRVVRRTFTTDKVDKPEVGSVSNTNPTRDNVVIEVKDSEYPMYYSLDNGNTWNEVNGDITVTENTNVLIKANDGVSDSEILTVPVNNIDRESPNSYEPTINKTSKSFEVTGSTTDNSGSNVTYEYKLNDGEYGTNNKFDNLTTGTYTVTIKVSDELGNSREIVKTVEILPPEKPEVSISNTNMTNQDVTVIVTNKGNYTVECLDGNNYVTCSDTKVFEENGTITYRFTDGINIGESKEVVINNIDKVAPATFTITISNQTTRSLTVDGSTTDNITENLTYSYRVDNGEWESSKDLDRITTGDHSIYCRAMDEAGNETIATVDVTMAALPSVSLSQDRTNLTKENVIVTVTNNSSFNAEYSLDDGDYQLVSDSNEITIERNALVKVHTTDGFNGGPISELNITNIDKEAPVINSLGITHTTRQIFFNVDATDDRSSTLTYQYQKNDEGWRTYSDFGYYTTGTYTMSVKAIDEALNETVLSEVVVLEPLQVPNMNINHTTWTNEQIRFELTDEHKEYKANNSLTLQFSLDGGSYGNVNSSYQMQNGTIKFRFTDGTNTGEDFTYVVDYYDDIAPVIDSVSIEKTTNTINVIPSATDDKTEVIYKYQLDSGSIVEQSPITGVTTGNHTVKTYAYDLAGNYSIKSDNVVIEPVPEPVIEASTTELTNQNVILSCTNKESFTLEVSTDGTNYQTINGTYEVEENNNYKFRLYDGVNYSSVNTFTVNNIDKLAPEFTERNYTTTSKSITMNYVATDDRSTNITYEYRIGNSVYDSSNVIDNLHTGTYQVTVKASDEAGNFVEEVVSVEVEPIAKPTYTISPDVMTKEDVVISITNKVTSQGDFTVEKKDNNEFVQATESITVTENGLVEVRFTDGINYSEVTEINIANIDKIPPYEFVPETVLTTSTITVNASTTDNMSQTITYLYKVDDQDYQSSNEFTFLGLGNHTVYVKATDEVGNERVVTKEVELIYIPEPEVSYLYNNGSWIKEIEVATITNKDVYTVEYKLNDGNWTSIQGDSFNIEENATVYVRLTNGTHYSDTYFYTITYIDRTVPYINELYITNKTSYSMTVNVDGGDNESGISWFIYKLGDEETPLSVTSRKFEGLQPDTEYTFEVIARDRAGNTYSKSITDRTASATQLFSIYTENAESDAGIDFNQTSSNVNGRGVYKTSNNIYYYRGEVDNYVLLGNTCFNIVRSTENNGTKLIYRGVANEGKCTATGANATLGTAKFVTKSEPFVNDLNYMTNGTRYNFMDLSSQSTSIRYASSYSYENGTYTLTNPVSSSDWYMDENYYYDTIGSNYKYTCFNGDSCTTLYYIINASSHEGPLYIELSNGDSLDAYKNNIFNGTQNSNIKTILDNWYQTNMSAYSSILDDAVYCSNKTVNNASDWGFLDNNSNNAEDTNLVFNANKSLSFACSSNDAYSKANGKLTYAVGLLSRDEYIYAGGREDSDSYTDSYLNIGVTEYTMTPDSYSFYDGTPDYRMYSFGKYLGTAAGNSYLYIRPVIALKNEALVSKGIGTSEDPYVIVTE